MRHLTWTVVLAAGMLSAGGCQSLGYNTQPLGDVGYAKAFQAGKVAMAQYFSVGSADAETGRITSRPQSADVGRDRLLGVSPARKVARLRIRRKGEQVYADVRVDVQRQDVDAMARMQPVTVNNDVPIQTPAQGRAALTSDQDQAWQNTGRDAALERSILDAMMDALKK